jgi:hypothetical protein
MSSIRIARVPFLGAARISVQGCCRSFTTTFSHYKDEESQRIYSNAPEHREYNKRGRPLNPAVPNTTSTQNNDFPKIREANALPDLISSVDFNYRPSDPALGKIEHMTGGTQIPGGQKPELGVGEMEGITFRVEPLRRVGEDPSTMRARLLCKLTLLARCAVELRRIFLKNVIVRPCVGILHFLASF